MSTYKCPECGNPINLNERHCANCDYDVTDSEYAALVPAQPTAPVVEKPKAPQVSAPQRSVAASGIDSIMAHGSVDASSHTTHTEDKSTHNIDNSQTVNNTNQTVTNTFIIMGGGPAPMPQNIDPQTAEALKQAQQAQAQQVPQQPAQPISPSSTQPIVADEGQKGIGSIDGRRPAPVKSSKKWWVAAVVVVVIVVIAVVSIDDKEEQPITQPTTTSITSEAPKTTSPQPSIAMSITFFIPNFLRKKGMSRIHRVSESCDREMSILVCSTANVPAYSSMAPKPLMKVLAYPFDTCNAAPSNIEKMKNIAILR